MRCKMKRNRACFLGAPLSAKFLLGLFEVSGALGLDLFVGTDLDPSLVGLHLTLESPTSGLLGEHGLDVNVLGGLGEFSEEGGQGLVADLVGVVGLELVKLEAGGGQGSSFGRGGLGCEVAGGVVGGGRDSGWLTLERGLVCDGRRHFGGGYVVQTGGLCIDFVFWGSGK